MSVHARSVRHIKGGVTVRDYRGTDVCPPNGGRIDPVVFIDHIPVIRNRDGVEDLLTLGRVLKAQGLAVQRATDAEGNVAQFTRLDALCYHARGANSISAGCEHMHYGLDEPWTERQFRAAAFVAWEAMHYHGIPLRGARLLAGNPTRVARSGHASHRRQAAAAGYHDRSDPGPGFRFAHVYELAEFYDRHRRF
jgi:hypothetical protein